MNLYSLFSTFFIWFLSWTLIETLMGIFRISLMTKLKIVIVLLVIALINYRYNKVVKEEIE